MHMPVSISFRFLVAVALASAASYISGALKLRQVIESPRKWVNLGRAPLSHIIPLHTGLF